MFDLGVSELLFLLIFAFSGCFAAIYLILALRSKRDGTSSDRH